MTLYKRDSKGKIRSLNIEVIGDEVHQTSGLLDGKKTTRASKCTPKNIGKTNETTGATQAVFEAESKITKKLREGYFKTKEDALEYEILLPMLAKPAKLEDLSYPILVQPKLDGMRCLGTPKGKISRKNKEILTMDHIDLTGIGSNILDGELYVHGLSFQDNMKLIKKVTKDTDKVVYHVYDLPSASGGFLERYSKLSEAVEGISNIEIVKTVIVQSEDELMKVHNLFINMGYEGSIIRLDNDTEYEFNKRSSNLLKLKDFVDAEYRIIDVVPSDKNPEQGVVRCVSEDGQEFNCGMKKSHAERVDILKNKKDYIGEWAVVTYFEKTDGGLPRFPVYKGNRLAEDMTK